MYSSRTQTTVPRGAQKVQQIFVVILKPWKLEFLLGKDGNVYSYNCKSLQDLQIIQEGNTDN